MAGAAKDSEGEDTPAMAKTRRTLDEQLEALRLQKEQIEKRLSAIETRKKDTDRKLDARRKIIVGGALITHAQIDPDFNRAMQAALQKAVAAKDKPLIADLLGEPGPAGSSGSGAMASDAASEDRPRAEMPLPQRSGRPAPQTPRRTTQAP